MKKLLVGLSLLISSVLWLCTLVICGFVNCIGEGKQSWSFTNLGFSDVIVELSSIAIIIPLAVLLIGIWFIISGFKE